MSELYFLAPDDSEDLWVQSHDHGFRHSTDAGEVATEKESDSLDTTGQVLGVLKNASGIGGVILRGIACSDLTAETGDRATYGLAENMAALLGQMFLLTAHRAAAHESYIDSPQLFALLSEVEDLNETQRQILEGVIQRMKAPHEGSFNVHGACLTNGFGALLGAVHLLGRLAVSDWQGQPTGWRIPKRFGH